MADLDVLGIAGSLRRDSFNRSLLRAAQEVAPPGMAIAIWEGLGAIPLYDGDVEAGGMPGPVAELKSRIERAGALLVVTPEYNHSVPGVLKNALDWASRPAGRSSLSGKVVAIAGASPGGFGTVRSQADLRRILAAMGAIVVPAPEVLVSQAAQKVDTSGRLADEPTRRLLGKLLVELSRWVERFPAG